MGKIGGSIHGNSGADDFDNRASRERSLRPTRSAYFSPISTSKTSAWSPCGSKKIRSCYFQSSPDSCAGSTVSFDWGSAFTERAVYAFQACPKYSTSGVRHLCERRCYLRAYEPCRKWHALRCALTRAGAPTRILKGWCVRMDGAEGHRHPWRVSYISPKGDVLSRKEALKALGLPFCGDNSPPSPWRERRRRKGPRRLSPVTVKGAVQSRAPPAHGPTYLLKEIAAGASPPSPFGLIEELLTDDPWKLLLGCIMLNQTTRSQMDPVLSRFLDKFPTAAATAAAAVDEVTRVAAPLGLQKRRPVAIIRFSQEYVGKDWNDPKELHWIGKYAADAYSIFVKGNWRDVQPNDHALNWWVNWKRGTEATGEGAEPSPANDGGGS
ncbi:unnamed protein product [Ascophyllum nodosum]